MGCGSGKQSKITTAPEASKIPADDYVTKEKLVVGTDLPREDQTITDQAPDEFCDKSQPAQDLRLAADGGDLKGTIHFVIRISCLEVHFLPGVRNYLLALDWDQGALTKRTEVQAGSPSLQFNGDWKFRWSVRSIQDLQAKWLAVRLCAEDMEATDTWDKLSFVNIPLYTLAHGPVHQDWQLYHGKGKQKEPLGRVRLEVTMSQECNLQVSPIIVQMEQSGGVSFAKADLETEDATPIALDSGTQMARRGEEDTSLRTADWMLSFVLTGSAQRGHEEDFRSEWVSNTVDPIWNALVSEDQLIRKQASLGNFDAHKDSKTASGISDQDNSSKKTDNSSHEDEERFSGLLGTASISLSTLVRLERFCSYGNEVQSLLKEKTLPGMSFLTILDALQNQSMKLQVWQRRSQLPASQVAGNSNQGILFGEAWLPYSKVFDERGYKNQSMFLANMFREKLLLNGKCVGEIGGLIVYQNNPVVRQLAAGLQTELGVRYVSPMILGERSQVVNFDAYDQMDIPAEVKEIAMNHKGLLDLLFNQDKQEKLETVTPTGSMTRRSVTIQRLASAEVGAAGPDADQLRSQVKAIHPEVFDDKEDEQILKTRETLCKKIQAELKKSHFFEKGEASFKYSTTTALVMSQKIFINLANHVIEYVQRLPWDQQGLYFAILHLIFRRKEMDFQFLLPDDLPKEFEGVDRHELRRILEDPSFLGEHKQMLAKLDEVEKSLYPTPLENENKRGQQSQIVRMSIADDKKAFNVAKKNSSGSTGYGHVHSKLSMDSYPSDGHNLCPPTQTRDRAVSEMSSNTHDKRDDEAPPSNEIIQKVQNASSDVVYNLAMHHRRMRVCRRKWLLLHKLLYWVCNQFNQNAEPATDLRKYLVIFSSILYFRVPYFRSQLINALLTQAEKAQDIEEWQGTQFSVDKARLVQNESWPAEMVPTRMVFDWSDFHQKVENHWGDANLTKTAKAMEHSGAFTRIIWKRHFSKRQVVFFSFINNWVKHVVQRMKVKEHFMWFNIPGYIHIVKAVILEMKKTRTAQYSDGLVHCCGTLLVNERLISSFVKTVFLKTSVHDQSAVFSTLQYFDFWIQVLVAQGKLLPDNFDFYLFITGVKMILKSDLMLNNCQCLWFLYRNLAVMYADHRRELVLHFLLKEQFVRFFCHWNHLVRKTFMHVLLYQILETARRCEDQKRWTNNQFVLTTGDTAKTPPMAYNLQLAQQCHQRAELTLAQLGAPAVFEISTHASDLDWDPAQIDREITQVNAYRQSAVQQFTEILAQFKSWVKEVNTAVDSNKDPPPLPVLNVPSSISLDQNVEG